MLGGRHRHLGCRLSGRGRLSDPRTQLHWAHGGSTDLDNLVNREYDPTGRVVGARRPARTNELVFAILTSGTPKLCAQVRFLRAYTCCMTPVDEGRRDA